MNRSCTVDRNKTRCACTFNCGKKGLCCECIGYHRSLAELPGCYFPRDAERTGDRSIANFISIVQQKGSSWLK